MPVTTRGGRSVWKSLGDLAALKPYLQSKTVVGSVAAALISAVAAFSAAPADPAPGSPQTIGVTNKIDVRPVITVPVTITPQPAPAPPPTAGKGRPVSKPETTNQTMGTQSPIVNTTGGGPVIINYNQPAPLEKKDEPPVAAAPSEGGGEKPLSVGQRNGIRYYEIQFRPIEEALETSADQEAARVLDQVRYFHRQNLDAIGGEDFAGSTKAVTGLNGVLHKKPISGVDPSLIYQHDPCQDDHSRPGCFRVAAPIVLDK